MRIRATPDPSPDIATDLEISPTRLANRHLALTLGPTGIPAIALHGRPLLGLTLHLRHDHTDTWSVETDSWREPIAARLAGATWQVEETGPLRARARLEHRLGTSRLRWTVSLHRDDPRVFLRLEINFDQRFSLLQLAMPLATPALQRTDAVPGGAIPRPLASTEYPVQGWSRLTTGDAAIALVTPDAYSLSAAAGLWQWTLMRSPRMAWQGGEPPVYEGRDSFTDQGMHDLFFELHCAPTLSDAALDIAARRMAQKPITFDRTEGMNRPLA